MTLLLFATEVGIDLYVHDQIIRPYIGDVLVVILIYCFVKSFLKLPVIITALFVLLFAFCIEFLQYFNIVEKLGLQDNKIARVVIGSSFETIDLLAYVTGICIVIGVEKTISKKKIELQ